MSWTYEQASGRLLSADGTQAGTGYSGIGSGLNNPDEQNVVDVGPLPQGQYTIGPPYDDPGGKGPVVMALTPDPSNVMFGRSGFLIHGDNANMNHTASNGCIILNLVLRNQIASSGDSSLTIVHG